MQEIWRKLTSRKLWLAIAGVCTGIALAFGVDGGEISTVAGAVTALLSVVAYVGTEGRVDMAAVKTAAQSKTETAGDGYGDGGDPA